MANDTCPNCNKDRLYETICLSCFSIVDHSSQNLHRIFLKAKEIEQIYKDHFIDEIIEGDEFLVNSLRAYELHDNTPVMFLQTNKRYILHQCKVIDSDWYLILKFFAIIVFSDIKTKKWDTNYTTLEMQDKHIKYKLQIDRGENIFDLTIECSTILAEVSIGDDWMLDASLKARCSYNAFKANKKLFSPFES